MEDKRLDTTQHLLGKGVRFLLPVPFFFRWLKIGITFKSHKAGTILMFSEVILKHDLEKIVADENDKELSKNIKPIVECLSISALNRYWKIKVFKKILSKYLLWQVDAKSLKEMFIVIYGLNYSKDFMIITKWYIYLMKQMMNPNLGQNQGS